MVGGHGFILPCLRCLQLVEEGREEFRLHLYSCCLSCLRSHFFILHHSDYFVTFYKEIRSNLMQNDLESSSHNLDLRNLEQCFYVRCFLCDHLFSSKAVLERHQATVCLPRAISASASFGLPLTRNLYRTDYTRNEQEKEEKNFLLAQTHKFLSKAQTSKLAAKTTLDSPTAKCALDKNIVLDALSKQRKFHSFDAYISYKMSGNAGAQVGKKGGLQRTKGGPKKTGKDAKRDAKKDAKKDGKRDGKRDGKKDAARKGAGRKDAGKDVRKDARKGLKNATRDATKGSTNRTKNNKRRDVKKTNDDGEKESKKRERKHGGAHDDDDKML